MIYYDLGCHNGQTIRDFLEGRFGMKPEGEVLIYAVDPLTKYADDWSKLAVDYIKTPHNFMFRQAAVYDRNDQILFSEREKTDEGSSIMPDKDGFNGGKKCLVDCFDFSEDIKLAKQNDRFGNKIYVRMDIEGAEYPVLHKMIADDTLKFIDYLEIEFHSAKMNGNWKNDEDKIRKYLRVNGINFKEIQ